MAEHEGFNDEQGTRRALEPTGSEASEIAGQGRMKAQPPAGTTPSHERPSFSDPVSANTDPTSPESPEQTLAFQHEQSDEADQVRREKDRLEPHQNIEDWRRTRVVEGDARDERSVSDHE
ncbi:MAG TPA: hypothetical protein VH277_13330 [Gemmatimonadaceae bacterium]|nr:hypothetical protein [Gemmatimonadaceae bacterium]